MPSSSVFMAAEFAAVAAGALAAAEVFAEPAGVPFLLFCRVFKVFTLSLLALVPPWSGVLVILKQRRRVRICDAQLSFVCRCVNKD